ncbi:MAG: hypothetical protein Q9172_003548 [Xanthocarpia lactea]
MDPPSNPIRMMTFVPNQQLQDSSATNPQRPSTVHGTGADPSGGYGQALSNTGPPVSASGANSLLPGLPPNHLSAQQTPDPSPRDNSNPVNSNPSVSPELLDPRKYRGYPAMCTWMASDDDFFVVRRFGRLSARVALLMQNRIVRLESIVHAEDAKWIKGDGDNGSFDLDPSKERQNAMDELVWRLEQYQRFVLDHSKLKARPDATKRQISNVKNWLGNNNGPIRPQEVSFIEEEGDLMPMVPRIKPPLRRFLDRFDMIGRIGCWRRKAKQLDQRHYNHPKNFESETTIYNIEETIDKFVTCVTIGLGLIMLIAPLWLLQYVVNDMGRLKIITGCLIVFTILLSIVVVARPFEVLAATAAYGAVLMVFMQLGGRGGR